MEIIVNNKIHLSGTTPALISQLKAETSVDNPEYREARRYERSTRGIPSKICLWEQVGDRLVLPRGYMGRLLWVLRDLGVEHQIKDKRVQLSSVLFPRRDGKLILRDYQKDAIRAADSVSQGIIQSPAGSGKTTIGMELIVLKGQPALWLTHTRELAEQAVDRAVSSLGLERKEIGMLGAGREFYGKHLTVGIVAKMAHLDMSQFDSLWGTVIVDEVHHTGGAITWVDIVNQIPARYRFGLTATLKRADGMEAVTEKVIGPLLHVVPRDVVQAEGGGITPTLRKIETGTTSKVWKAYEESMEKWRNLAARCRAEKKREPRKPLLPYGAILTEMLEDAGRNRLIVETLARECLGHSSLVLSERVEHCEWLKNEIYEYGPGVRAAVIHGKLNKTKRREVLAAMESGELDILFAVDIAKEGLDIPRLDRLFLVGGGRNEAEVEQKVGRIQRPFAGKEDAVVFDFVDEKIGVFQNQFWARRRVYRKLGIVT